MATIFGKFLKDLRHTHVELLKDMADKLDVSPAFLSAVESGSKSVPPTWEAMVATAYNLSREQRASLSEAIDQSKKNVTIDLTNQSAERRGIAVALARQFDELSDAQLELIKKTMFATKNRKKD